VSTRYPVHTEITETVNKAKLKAVYCRDQRRSETGPISKYKIYAQIRFLGYAGSGEARRARLIKYRYPK
jgi:hypothetical protein